MVAIIFLLICGCASVGNTPIESRAQPPSRKITTHIVEAGDTLYSIAWRYETDYKKLATINGIRAPYRIYKGQKIRLSGPASQSADTGHQQTNGSRQSANASHQQAGTNRQTAAGAARSASNTKAASQPRTAPARPSTTGVKVPSAPLPASVDGWNWPLNGKVVKTFGANDLTKGITIDSSAEKQVRAAAEGLVVYSGSGVRGYGNFLILKHSELFLSAYAYNSKLLVKEGEQVRKGQNIAVTGQDVDGRPRLYFEIRKDGKPVDPIRYLPKR